MRAWICDGFGPPSALRLGDWPSSKPGFGEVRIRIAHAALNFPDLLSISGAYPIKSTPPFIPGLEGAGEVIACGPEVTRCKLGDRVCWQDNRVKASFAEEITLPEIGLARIPNGVSTELASAVPTAFGTAHFCLTDRARLQRGETVVVHGASGGVGLACVQLGKFLGARVIATGSDDGKLATVRAVGADHVVNVRTEPVRERLLELTNGRGADVFCDPVGGEVFDLSFRAIAPLGRLLVIGFTSNVFPVVKANILLVKAASVIGANYGHFLETKKAKARNQIEMMLGAIAEHRFTPYIYATYKFEDCVEALNTLRSRKVVGKCTLAMR
jgi:NADPH2:quinone reductase